MKILSAEQIRQADAFSIKNEPIASVDLMERASSSFVKWYVDRFDSTIPAKIFCGTGNNGGDGLAIARLLSQRGYSVEAFVIDNPQKGTDDFKINYDRLQKVLTVQAITESYQFPTLSEKDVIIDAIFGSGLSRIVEGFYADVVDHINQSGSCVVSVDIPSGLLCDDICSCPAVQANYTVSFQTPKLAFFLPTNYEYVGSWHVVDIGLDTKFIAQSESLFSTIETPILPKRKKNSHKGSNGRALLIAGSYGKMGAAVLSAKAAMRSGLGLLTVHVPHCGYDILQTSIPEAMVSPDPTEFYFGELPENLEVDAIGIGPGLDTKQKSLKALEKLLSKLSTPIVIDADAINLIAANRHFLNLLPENSILTPHHKEFERLVGIWSSDKERINRQLSFSKEFGVYVVFKGPNTAISTPEGEVFFNTTGNPGMATAGSGDVLTGIITALLAQNYSSLDAARIGVHVHGMAGDLAAEKNGEVGLIASDIIGYLPQAFSDLA